VCRLGRLYRVSDDSASHIRAAWPIAASAQLLHRQRGQPLARQSGPYVPSNRPVSASEGSPATVRDMPGHERRDTRAERQAVSALEQLGHEIRLARLAHDLSQRTAAGAVGLSHTSWGRIERGRGVGVTVPTLARVLSVVGLELHLRAYPSGSAIRDQAHVRLLEELRRRLGPSVRWRTEVPLPDAHGRRSWDALVLAGDARVGVEAETRARDAQELQIRVNGKRRDGAVDHVILLLADTRHDRAFLRSVGSGFHADFPVPGRVALEHLARSEDPGGSAIVLLRVPRA
jgi:transcriptional regulator with XRE-family HTH domain